MELSVVARSPLRRLVVAVALAASAGATLALPPVSTGGMSVASNQQGWIDVIVIGINRLLRQR